MNRIFLFIGTNIAILVVLSLVMQLLDIESLLNEQGTQLDLRSLLIFSAVIGFVGSFISLAISKWSAKRLTGARVIKTPQNATESWLLNTVQRQAQVAEIGMPEVAIYDAPDVLLVSKSYLCRILLLRSASLRLRARKLVEQMPV